MLTTKAVLTESKANATSSNAAEVNMPKATKKRSPRDGVKKKKKG
jgi:hypothetical protein